jgi:hypothetical protein
MSLLLAAQSSNAPDIAGNLFTLHQRRRGSNNRLNLKRAQRYPYLSLQHHWIPSRRLKKSKRPRCSSLTAESKAKLSAAVHLVEENLDFSLLEHFESDAH